MSRKVANTDSVRRWHHEYDFLAKLSPFQGLERGQSRFEGSPTFEAYWQRTKGRQGSISSFSPVASPFSECRPNVSTPAERAAAERLSSLRGRSISPFERSIKLESPLPKFSDPSANDKIRAPDSSRQKTPRLRSQFPTPFSPRIVQSLDIVPSRAIPSPPSSHKRKKVVDTDSLLGHPQDDPVHSEVFSVPIHTGHRGRGTPPEGPGPSVVARPLEESAPQRGPTSSPSESKNPRQEPEQVQEQEGQAQESKLKLKARVKAKAVLTRTEEAPREMVVKEEPTEHTPREGGEREGREMSRTMKVEEEKKEGLRQRFTCKICGMDFDNGQALGGHMSRTHPGKSRDFNHKKDVRKRREFDRVKLLLAKKRFFSNLNYDYEDLISTPQGKVRAKSLMNRSKIKRLKTKITDDEVNNYVESHALSTNHET